VARTWEALKVPHTFLAKFKQGICIWAPDKVIYNIKYALDFLFFVHPFYG